TEKRGPIFGGHFVDQLSNFRRGELRKNSYLHREIEYAKYVDSPIDAECFYELLPVLRQLVDESFDVRYIQFIEILPKLLLAPFCQKHFGLFNQRIQFVHEPS